MLLGQDNASMRRLSAAELVDDGDPGRLVDRDRPEAQLFVLADPGFQTIARAVLALTLAERHVEEVPADVDLVALTFHFHILWERPALVTQEGQVHLLWVDRFQ